MTRSRTLLGTVLAAVAVLVSACSAHPGAAAVVGAETISEAQVDDVAAALCSAQSNAAQPGQPQDRASRGARQGALDVLIQASLSRQFGESQGVEPDQGQVSSALAANAQSIQGLPADRREVFRDTLREYAEGQLMLLEIGTRELRKDGAGGVPQDQAIAEGVELRNAWVRSQKVDVSVDPRYGEFSQGALLATSGSLSVASSSRAADGDSPEPSAGWVSALPASQKCG